MDAEHEGEGEAYVALTAREIAVLQLLVEGWTAKDIAAKLGIAARTVEKHVDHVRMKLRAKNRAHLTALAIGLGLVKR
jgi:DNA-binding NarL/FixJ family response regulator